MPVETNPTFAMRIRLESLRHYGGRLLRPGFWLRAMALALGLALLAALGTSQVERMRAHLAQQAAKAIRVEAVVRTPDGSLRETVHYVANSVAAMERYFEQQDYRLAPIRLGEATVPRIFVNSLPQDMDAIQVVERRKKLFIRIMLPLVLRENERLRTSHERLQALEQRLTSGKAISPAERQWLTEKYRRYRVPDGELETLVRRVDVIPTSLAMAQAAAESGWGTSRFALEGNALFGQWTWSRNHDGLVPRERDAGRTYRVRAFTTLEDSVHAYMLTLNRQGAYRDFRLGRARQRQNGVDVGEGLDGVTLAAGVKKYSVGRHLYVSSLRSIMRVNGLTAFDGAPLTLTPIAAAVELPISLASSYEPGR